MVMYELKKVLGKKSSKIILVFIVLLTIWFCRSTIRNVEWIDADGNVEVGLEAARKLRTAQKEWTGELDEAMLHKALVEVKRLDSMPEYLSTNYTENRIAQGWRQGIREIRQMLNLSFAEGYLFFDDRVAHMVSFDELSNFYINRTNLLKEWLYDESNLINSGFHMYSDNEKQFLIDRYSTLQTPFQLDYAQGWIQMMARSGTVMQMGIILLGLILTEFFFDEFQWKTDSVYYSSMYGRSKATRAKLIAGFLLIAFVFFISMGAYSVIILSGLGFDGGKCPIQVSMNYWKSIYNLSFTQAYLLILGMGFVGYLFIGFLVMLISVKSRSQFLAVMLPPLLILLPNFLKTIFPNVEGDFISKLLCLLPHQMLNGGTVICRLELYSFGKMVLPSVPVLIVFYVVLFLLLVYLCYIENRRKQIF